MVSVCELNAKEAEVDGKPLPWNVPDKENKLRILDGDLFSGGVVMNDMRNIRIGLD